MPFFISKLLVEAVRYDGENIEEVIELSGDRLYFNYGGFIYYVDNKSFYVEEGDWVVKGWNDNLFVLTPEEFESAYEPLV